MGSYREQLREAKQTILSRALHEAGGNVRKAAAGLAVNRTLFYVLMRQAGMEPRRHLVASYGNDAWRSLAH